MLGSFKENYQIAHYCDAAKDSGLLLCLLWLLFALLWLLLVVEIVVVIVV